MTSQGSAYARFQRALKTGNLTLIRNAAGELPRVELADALAVCIAMREAEPQRFERAALRWLARFASSGPKPPSPKSKARHGHSRTSQASQQQSKYSNGCAPGERAKSRGPQ